MVRQTSFCAINSRINVEKIYRQYKVEFDFIKHYFLNFNEGSGCFPRHARAEPAPVQMGRASRLLASIFLDPGSRPLRGAWPG